MMFEGFAQARATHGVVYLEFVADGDTDLQKVLRKLEYSDKIKWISCSNHRIKGTISGYEKVAKEKTS